MLSYQSVFNGRFMFECKQKNMFAQESYNANGDKVLCFGRTCVKLYHIVRCDILPPPYPCPWTIPLFYNRLGKMW